LKVNHHSEGTNLHLQGRRRKEKQETSVPFAFTLLSCLAYSLMLMMEAIYFSDTLADFQLATGHYIPQD
jgi:hypothetical protein